MSRWQGHKEAVFAGALILAGLADGGLALQIRFSSDDEGGLRRGAGRHVTEDTNNVRGCHALLAGPEMKNCSPSLADALDVADDPADSIFLT